MTRQKKTFVMLATLVFFLHSCTKEPDYTSVHYTISNQSNHAVKIIFFNQNNDLFFPNSTLFLDKIDSLSFIRSGKGLVEHPFPYTDSVYLFFDDTVRVVFNKISNPEHNLLNIESYSGGKVKELEYKYWFKLTEDDYLNAFKDNLP
mgnify:CR=1 FL=1